MKKWLIGLGLIIVVVSGIVLFNIKNIVEVDTIYEGISIAEIDLSNKTKEEALKTIKAKKEEEIREKSMKLIGREKEYNIALNDIGFDYEYEKAVDDAYKIARDGNIFQRYKKIKSLEQNKKDIELESFYNKEKIVEKSINIEKELNREVVNSEFDFNGGNPRASEEALGYQVDEKELSAKIEDNIYKLEDIEIPIETIKPTYTKDYYSKINGVIGSSSTSFKTSGAGRVQNIQLSTRAFNGKILHPGDSISYNSTVGPVSTAAGYRDAPVIVAGDLTPGVGGGICQTSTTLYNALLRADLTVTERSHHSIPSSYMEKGLDAVVAGNYLDLKFKNDFDYPIYISSRVVNRTVYFDIYGDRENRDYTIQMEPKIREVIPHKTKEVLKGGLAPGTRELVQAGRNGYKLTTYKHKIKNGKVFESKAISNDYYKEREAIYNVGPEKMETKKEEVVKKEETPKKEEVEELLVEE